MQENSTKKAELSREKGVRYFWNIAIDDKMYMTFLKNIGIKIKSTWTE